ncbi:MAG TPA: PEP-CTERM sorting domain-containing protein [Chthoniobacterales bacterium]
MKKLLLATAFLGVTLLQVHAGTSHIDFSLGLLSNSSGVALSDGSLIQIIAAPTGSSFANPTATNFLGGSSDEYIVYSGAFDSSTSGTPGSEIFSVNIDLTTFPVAGDALVVRWYPSLTTSSSAPGFTTYGQFGYPDNPSLLDSNNTWLTPSAGNSGSYSFITSSLGGSYPDSKGFASHTITPVPEPSSSIAIVALCATVVAIRHRRRIAQAVR